jgi:hypothetical protein
MKTININPDEFFENPPDNMEVADAKADPEDVLERVDNQLRALGFEIVIYEVADSCTSWTIERISTRLFEATQQVE